MHPLVLDELEVSLLVLGLLLGIFLVVFDVHEGIGLSHDLVRFNNIKLLLHFFLLLLHFVKEAMHVCFRESLTRIGLRLYARIG